MFYQKLKYLPYQHQHRKKQKNHNKAAKSLKPILFWLEAMLLRKEKMHKAAILNFCKKQLFFANL